MIHICKIHQCAKQEVLHLQTNTVKVFFFSPLTFGVQVADSSCSEEAQTDRTMALLALGSDSPIAGPTLKSRLMLERDW